MDKCSVVVVTPSEATAISADITSDAGSESVELVESGAWVHASTYVKELSPTGTEAKLTLYDDSGVAQMSFSGTVTADGEVLLTADPAEKSTVCDSKLGCPETTPLDIELVAAEVFVNPDGGYDITFDLSGADIYGRTTADFQGTLIGIPQADPGRVVTSDVTFGEIGAMWEGELALEPGGEVEVDTASYDSSWKKLEKSTLYLGHILHTGQDSFASGHAMLSAGSGGSVGFHRGQRGYHKGRMAGYDSMVVATDAWTTTTAPATAQLELDGGETLTIPANSYQRAGVTAVDVKASGVVYLNVTINGGNLTLNGSSTISLSDLSSPVCVNGTCVALSENAGGTLDLSVTGYALTAAKVASGATIGIVTYDKGGAKTDSASAKVTYDDAVAVVFANEVDLAEDPTGLDLGGQVSLLGASDSKGKQKTFAKGDFYGSFVRTGEGDLSLGAVDKNDIDAKGDILIGGEPIDFELTDVDKDGVIEAPPVVFLRVDSNGKGTRAATTASSGNPGLL